MLSIPRRIARALVVGLMILPGFACNDRSPTAPGDTAPSAIRLSTVAVVLTALGETTTLEPAVLDRRGRLLGAQQVGWSSADPGVATVEGGIVTAVANGETLVTVSLGRLVVRVPVLVQQRVTAIEVQPRAVVLASRGATIRKTAEARDARGQPVAQAAVRWRTEDPAVAAVDTAGVVTAVGAGRTGIIAEVDGVQVREDVTVSLAAVTVRVTPSSAILTALGEPVGMSADVLDARGNSIPSAPVDWTSSDPAVATVTSDGVVTAAGLGAVTITATSGAASGAATLTVSQAASALLLAPASITLGALGANEKVVAEVQDARGSRIPEAVVQWATTAPDVARVSTTGTVTAVANGTATISATSGGASASIVVTVAQVPASVTVAPAALSFDVLGATASLTALVRDAGGSAIDGAPVLWMTTDPDVATVSADGVVTAVADGTTSVRASAGDVTSNAVAVTVAATPVEPWSLEWIRQPSTSFFSPAVSVGLDASGNSYVAGRYSGSLTLGGVVLPEGSPWPRGVLAKYDPAGNPQWVLSLGGTVPVTLTGLDVAPDGGACAVGYFRGTITVGPGYTFTTRGFDDTFVAKYASNGTLEWAVAAGGASSDVPWAVAVDGAGACIVTGRFRGTMVFDAGNSLTADASRDAMFVAKYAGAALQWVRGTRGSDAEGRGVDVDGSGNVYVAGGARIGTTFSGTSLSVVNGGNWECFVAKYAPNGALQWVRGAGGPSQDQFLGIAVDASGNSHVTGLAGGSAVFGSTTLPPSDILNMIVAKLDAQGNVLWAVAGTTTDSRSNVGFGVALGLDGNVYASGQFYGDLTFGTARLTGIPGLTSDATPFIALIGPSGMVQSTVRGLGGSLVTDGARDVWVASGSGYLGSIEFAGTPVTFVGDNSLYLARIRYR